VPRFIGACREWALEAAAGEEEMLASAYSYVLRQRKYPDTDVERSMALAEGCYSRLRPA
jgi:hypothetical protein